MNGYAFVAGDAVFSPNSSATACSTTVPLKKSGLLRVCSMRGVGERELAEILLGDEALLHHLERFGNHLPEIGHVEMREVGAEDRPQPDAHAGIEGPHGRSVVGLAAEVEVAGEDRPDILF